MYYMMVDIDISDNCFNYVLGDSILTIYSRSYVKNNKWTHIYIYISLWIVEKK